MYATGNGVSRDAAEAVRWYRLSAEQGNAIAQKNLGAMYYYGTGALEDAVSAHMWLNISSANGSEDARANRDTVETKLTQKQIAEATHRAKVCMSSDYQDCD